MGKFSILGVRVSGLTKFHLGNFGKVRSLAERKHWDVQSNWAVGIQWEGKDAMVC